jgi:hypothetical protein
MHNLKSTRRANQMLLMPPGSLCAHLKHPLQ